jgi:hypothetical protein
MKKILFSLFLILFFTSTNLMAEEILMTCKINKHITHYGGLKGLNEPELILEGNAIDSIHLKKEFLIIDFEKKKLIDSSFHLRTKFSDVIFFDKPFSNISGDFAVLHNDDIDPKISGDFRENIRLFRITGELTHETNWNPWTEFYKKNPDKTIGFKVTRIYDCIKDDEKI